MSEERILKIAKAGHGRSRRGTVWHGMVRQGLAWPGKARQGKGEIGGWSRLAACLTILLFLTVLVAPMISGDEIIDYYVTSEVIVKGTSSGFANEGAADSSTNQKVEANNGTVTTMVLPNADVSIDWDYAGYTTPPCPVGAPPTSGVHAGALTCPAPTGSLEQDGNQSYITSQTKRQAPSADLSDWDRFDVPDPSLPAGTVISGLTVFVWARRNGTDFEPPHLDVNLNDGTACTAKTLGYLTLVFTNYTSTSWTTSCSGDAWTVTDLASLDFLIGAVIDYGTTDSIYYTTATYAGVLITYQTDYWMDISQTINVPTEQVNKAEIFLSCSLGGDTEGLTMQIQGTTAATGLCVAPYIDTSYETSYRGDIVVRMYSNPDATQTTYSVDLLVARVTMAGGGGGSLKPPIPICTYDALNHVFWCKDAQEYGNLDVRWIRWSVDGWEGVRGEPGGQVILKNRDSGFGQSSHLIRAVAVYASGAEVEAVISITADNAVWIIIMLAAVVIFILIVGGILEKRRKKKLDG